MNEEEDLLRTAVSPAYWAACTAHLTAALHNTTLRGKFLLQADEILNIGAAVRERYNGHDGNGRCLKLLLTDGVQQVAALEYRPIAALRATTPAGTKLLLRDVPVRRGMMLLTPQNCSVLGGSVPALEAARQRMVAHWSQPAVGRRGPPPSIQQATAAATQAAWADGTANGGLARPPQHQLIQPSAQQQRQHQQQQQLAMGPRPSQQSTQLLSQQRQQAGGGRGPERMHAQPMQQAAGETAHPPLPLQPQASMQRQRQQHVDSGSGRAHAPHAPLQELNGAPAGTANKRSRLTLHKHAPAAGAQHPSPQQQQLVRPLGAAAPEQPNFSFAQPPQRVPGAPPLAPQRVQAYVPPQLLHRLRESAAAGAAAGGLAAGTDDDPICLVDDDRRAGRAPPPAQPGSDAMAAMPAAAAGPEADAPAAANVDVEMADADQPADDGGWQGEDADNAGWEEPPGGHIDPWEQGYDESLMPADDGGGWQNDAAGGYGNDSGGDAGQAAGEGGPMWDAEDGPQQLQWQGEAGAASAGAEPAAATAEDGSGNGWVDEEEAEQPGKEPQQQQQEQQSPVIETARLPVVHAPSLAAVQHHAQGRSSSKAVRQLPVHQGESSEGSSQPRQSGSQAVRGKQQQRTVVKAAAAADDAASTRSTAMGLQLPGAAPRTVTKPAAASSPQQAGVQAGLGLPGVPEVEPLDPELLKAAPTLADVLLANPAADTGLPSLHTHAGGAAAAAGRSAEVGALPAALPTQPAGPQRQAAYVAAPQAAAAGDSDEDMPSFGLLGDLSPPKPRQAGPAASMDEPFCYLLHLAARASSAGPADFPICSRILATVKTFVGKLQFRDLQTGAPQYGMEMLVEDGSLVVRAGLDHSFIARLFEMEPPEFEACLVDPARRGHAAELAKGLQQLMASYSGLMEVRLLGAGQRLEVTNLLGDLTAEQAEAFHERATGVNG
ncbi:hypothetical protein ABPG77_004570 [Micractinium sp. CCAP 211/92]